MNNIKHNNLIENVVYDDLPQNWNNESDRAINQPQVTYVYDLETYKNFFSAVFINPDNIEDIYIFITTDGRDDFPLLRDFLGNPDMVLVGHNNFTFDRPLLIQIQDDFSATAYSIWELGQLLIKTQRGDRRDKIPDYYRLFFPKSLTWSHSIDTLELTRVNQLRVSLKHAGIVLHQKRLQDLPLEPSSLIQEKDIVMMIDYNINDVMITIRLFQAVKPLLELRKNVSDIFNVDVLSQNDTTIAKKILAHLVSDITGLDEREFKDRRSPRKEVHLKDCISNRIKFVTPEFNALLEHLKTITVYENGDDAAYTTSTDESDLFEYFGGAYGDTIVNLDSSDMRGDNFKMPKYVDNPSKELQKILVQDKSGRYLLKINYANVTFGLGIGGLHSESPPEILKSGDGWTYQEVDGGSFYPMIMIKNGFFPEHLPEMGVVFPKMVDMRLENKELGKDGDKMAGILAQILKISINSAFGLGNSPYYFLYDPKVMVSVTVSGQLILLNIIERLHLLGIAIIGANTDGINIHIHDSQMQSLIELVGDKEQGIVGELVEQFGILFDRTVYETLVVRDVNNYLVQKTKGVKLKGAFAATFSNSSWLGYKEFFDLSLYNSHINNIRPDDSVIERAITIPSLAKGVKHNVVPIALYEYYINSIPVEETIHKHNSIFDYMIAQRADTKKFIPTLIGIDENGEPERIELQKSNRVIVVNSGYSLVKIHKQGGRDSSILAGKSVMVLNDVESENPKDYPLDYQFYIDECYKIIDKVSPINNLEF